MAAIFREDIELYPHREQASNTINGHVVHYWKCMVDFLPNSDNVDYAEKDYDPSLPDHRVRIPVLMVHRTFHPLNYVRQRAIEQSWRARMRREPKTHMWVDAQRHQLQQNVLYWQQFETQNAPNQPPQIGRRLDFGVLSSINVVYPCFKQEPNYPDPVILYGVCFCRGTGAQHTRTYLRFGLEDNQSEWVFDITQDFINENANPHDLIRHHKNLNLFRNANEFNDQNSIAFYVCRGARLMVSDGRSPSPIPGHGHIRSLYQAGSLVVCTGDRGIDIGYVGPDGSVSIGWRGLYSNEHQLLRPLNRARRNLDHWERARDPIYGQNNIYRLNDFLDHVIFLGAIESEFNSACWKLNIYGDKQNPEFCRTMLTIPNEGIIEDIAPWNSGFELIRARQQYEQPWRNVVRYPANTRVPEFVVPNGHAYVIPRILGVGEWGPLWINYPYERYGLPRLAQFIQHDSIHRYMAGLLTNYQQGQPMDVPALRNFEQLTQWHLSPWKDWRPPTPPLLPPVMVGQAFHYLPLGAKVTIAGNVGNDIAFNVSGYQGQYRIVYSYDQPGHLWVDSTQVSQNLAEQRNQEDNPGQHIDWTQWLRYGADQEFYNKVSSKTHPNRYQTKIVVLKRIV